MIIQKVWSETGLLVKPVTFEKGLNFIIGNYSKGTKGQDVNGIGKSNLIRLIDFLLLSDTAESIYNNNKHAFLKKENHSASLQFSIGDQQYIIMRRFLDLKNVSFGTAEANLTLYSAQEMREILNSLLFPLENSELLLPGNYLRTLLPFYIKDDLKSNERQNPLKFSSALRNELDIQAFNTFLLGIPTDSIFQYRTEVKSKQKLEKVIQELKKDIEKDTGHSPEELQSTLTESQRKIHELEDLLKEFELKDYIPNLEKDLEHLALESQRTISKHMRLSRELGNIQKDLDSFPDSIDTARTEAIYNDLIENFGTFVRKKLDEVQAFKEVIIKNRARFLKKKATSITEELESLNTQLKGIESKRQNLLKKLDRAGGVESIKDIYSQLIETRMQHNKHSSKLDAIEERREQFDTLVNKINNLAFEIRQLLRQFQTTTNEIREMFLSVLKSTIYMLDRDETPVFAINTSENQTYPIKIEMYIPKELAFGKSRHKLIVYDLTVFLWQIQQQRKLPKFLVHDGAFHGISRRTVIKTLNYIYEKHLEMNARFQYIATFNSDELSFSVQDLHKVGHLNFDMEEHTVLHLFDSPDGMLFKRAYK